MKLKFDLKKLLDDYEARTGLRPHYSELSELTKIATDTLKSIASRSYYNTTLETLASLGEALGVDPRHYLIWEDEKRAKQKK